MRAQVLRAYDEKLSNDQWVSEERVPDPKLTKSTDVIVRIGGAGVCRTELHIIEGVWKPHMDPTGDKLPPIIMGHENAGWIEDVGKEVEGLKKGDPVIVHPKITAAPVSPVAGASICMAPARSPALIATAAMQNSFASRNATLCRCHEPLRQKM
jgi:NADPH:quinone reductase-like Zn-dependent oxidoreductase